MDKARKKELLRQYAQAQRKNFEYSLPFGAELFRQLFAYLDEKLGGEGCDDTAKNTVKFLADHGLPVEESLAWMRENGGYCDCEVLANIEDKIAEP
jgi:hypothetical protein